MLTLTVAVVTLLCLAPVATRVLASVGLICLLYVYPLSVGTILVLVAIIFVSTKGA